MKAKQQAQKLVRKLPIFFVVCIAILFFTACSRYDDDNEIFYYDIYGEGYVYNGETNLPIEGLEITLEPDVDWGVQGLMAPSNPIETLYTDSKGYYRLHFIKKIYGKYPVRYLFMSFLSENMPVLPYDSLWYSTGGPGEIPPRGTHNVIPLSMIENAKENIQFDTIKLVRKPKFNY